MRNDTRRFKTFVANRIYQIKENADVEQWSYIPTRENSADDASMGLNAEWESSDSCCTFIFMARREVFFKSR